MRREHWKRWQRKKYEEKSFRNPYFPKRRHWPWKMILISLTITATSAGLLTWLLRADHFAITEVGVAGAETLTPEEISLAIDGYLNEPVGLFFHRSNIFLFDQLALRERLNDNFSFQELTIELTDRRLTVRVSEKVSSLLWLASGQRYLVDLKGTVVTELKLGEDSQANFPLVIDLDNAPVVIGATVMSESEVSGLLNFLEMLKGQNILAEAIRLDRLAGKWASVRVTNGYDILFDPTSDISRQVTNLVTVLREEISDPSQLEYIDLRFGDHVYFK